MAQPGTIKDREYHKFIESPTRPGESAIEVVATFDGSATPVPVFVVESDGDQITPYYEETAVAAGIEIDLFQYTVDAAPIGFFLNSVDFSGSNVATYNFYIDGVLTEKKRTYFTRFDGSFQFKGFKFNSGQVIRVSVIHDRPTVGDFNATLKGSYL